MMDIDQLLTPNEAAKKLGISPSTITRCVQRGAPVHHWGATGKRYRIDLGEFIPWMEAQGAAPEKKMAAERALDIRAMQRARREMVRKKPRMEVAI